MRTEPPEDCDSQCRSQSPPFQCCGGCPVQCYCRLEREADYRAAREDATRDYGYDDTELNDEFPAESDYGGRRGSLDMKVYVDGEESKRLEKLLLEILSETRFSTLPMPLFEKVVEAYNLSKRVGEAFRMQQSRRRV